MEFAVLPVLHKYGPPPPAVNVTLPPVQNANGPEAVMVATGNGSTVIVCADVSLPHEFETSTVYVPALPTVIEDVVAPVLHK